MSSQYTKVQGGKDNIKTQVYIHYACYLSHYSDYKHLSYLTLQVLNYIYPTYELISVTFTLILTILNYKYTLLSNTAAEKSNIQLINSVINKQSKQEILQKNILYFNNYTSTISNVYYIYKMKV